MLAWARDSALAMSILQSVRPRLPLWGVRGLSLVLITAWRVLVLSWSRVKVFTAPVLLHNTVELWSASHDASSKVAPVSAFGLQTAGVLLWRNKWNTVYNFINLGKGCPCRQYIISNLMRGYCLQSLLFRWNWIWIYI